MVIAVANNKGGVGKTTTTQAILNGAQKLGKRTLGIDLDFQGNLTFVMGIDKPRGEQQTIKSAYELLRGEAPIKKVIKKTKSQGDIIPAFDNLADIDLDTTIDQQVIFRLRDQIAVIKNDYDVIVIDTHPGVNKATIAGLLAADSVIIPMCPDMYSIQGLDAALSDIGECQKLNQNLKVAGVLFTKVRTRSTLQSEAITMMRAYCKANKIPIFKATISSSPAMEKVSFRRKNIFSVAGSSSSAADYKELLNELGIK